jgi:uncharacterized radical SAM superfamily protein
MARFSPEAIWNANEYELLNLLDTGGLVQEPKRISFCAPSFMYYRTSYHRSSPNRFSTISVTGKTCAVNCRHCGGKILETMHAAETPKKLFAMALRLKRNGALGCLVSGGCHPDGSVPLERFLPVLARIKTELDLTVIVHTGIVNTVTAKGLKNAGVDAALIDILGSDETIKKVCSLNATCEDYENSLKAFEQARVKFVPHAVVGLHDGKLRGEFHALEIAARHNPSALVVIAFMPIRGTMMARVKPPRPADIARVVAAARSMLPETPIALGCMRPRGKHRAETDVLAVKAGANAIAFPSEEAIEYAKRQGFEVSFSPYCCSQIYVDLPNQIRSSSK